MSSFLFRRRKPKQQFRGHRRLRAEALERRTMLTSVTALPFSIVLLDQSSNSFVPPDPCIQFSPQPLVSAAMSKMAIHWQGQFSERLQDSSPAVTFEPKAWLVDVVYNLNQGLSPTPVPPIIVKGGYNFFVSGTATETLTPLNASGNPIASAQVWVSKDSIQSEVMVFPSNAMNPVANNFMFSTDTTIRQAMSPLAAATTTQNWIANTTTDTTGTIIEAPSFLSGTLSLTEQINQILSQASATALGPTWTINAKFVGGGTYQETLPPIVITVPSGTLALTGALTGTVSPPKGSLLPTQLIDSQVKASVMFSPAFTPVTTKAAWGDTVEAHSNTAD